MTLQEKLLIALGELMEVGDRNITRYKISKVAGVDSSAVYKFFNNIKLQKV